MSYDLYSNDWTSIQLLHSQHLKAETLYVEQLHRWGLQHGRAWGVEQIRQDDLQVFGSATGYELSLRFCKAITPQGYIIDVDLSREQLTLQGSNSSHRDEQVPIFIGVDMEKEPANAGSSQTGALLDRPILRWHYVLTTEPNSATFDWLQVGRMRKRGPEFKLDEEFIPQCVHLRSHPVLFSMAEYIVAAAGRALQGLDNATRVRVNTDRISTEWLALIGVMISTLAPATMLLDWEVHPRAYLERLGTVLKAYSKLLPLLQPENANWDQAAQFVENALKGLQNRIPPDATAAALNGGAVNIEHSRPNTFWWIAFEDVRKAFEALAALFESLSPRAATEEPRPPTGQGGQVFKVKDVQPAGPARVVGS